MKNRDIMGGKGPSSASDKATEKLAKTWKPKSLNVAAKQKKLDLYKSDYFHFLSEAEKKAIIKGFDSAVSAIRLAIHENYHTSKRIKEWKERESTK